MKTKAKDVFYQIRVEEELKKDYLDACEKNGLNASGLVRNLMKATIEQYKNSDRK